MAITKKDVFLLLLIILTAVFFRTWQLHSIPPGLYPDEAINGNDALETLKTRDFELVYPENNGREGLFIWLISACFSIFGISIWSLRIVASFVGIITVLGLYLLTKELFSLVQNYRVQSSIIGLFSSFFLAVSFWHINFSRIVFRGILVPFLLVFSFYFLLKGFLTQKKFYFIITGILLGLGLYTYTTFRMAPLLLIVFLIPWWLIYKKKKSEKKFFKLTLCLLVSAMVVVLPLAVYFIKNPQFFIGRTSQISIFSQPNIPESFIKSLISHLGMFNFYGDGNWRHNLSGSPQLFWPVGILFLLGFFISIKELISSIKNKNYNLFFVHCLLLSWFLIMLLPAALTYEGIPHALRTIGVIPAVYIFAGLGAWQSFHWIEKNSKNKKLLVSGCVLFLLLVLIFQFNKYFINWSSHTETRNAFSNDIVQIGNCLNSLPPQTQKIVIVNLSGVLVPQLEGIPMPAQTIMFIENAKYGKTQSLYLLPEDLNKIEINERPIIIIPITYEQNIFQMLQLMFPKGKIEKENGFLIYKI